MMPQKLFTLWSSSGRSFSDAYKQRVLRPVFELADMETFGTGWSIC